MSKIQSILREAIDKECSETPTPAWSQGYNARTQEIVAKIPEIEKSIIEEIWEMRECARNDGQIQYLATYDDIIKNLTS